MGVLCTRPFPRSHGEDAPECSWSHPNCLLLPRHLSQVTSGKINNLCNTIPTHMKYPIVLESQTLLLPKQVPMSCYAKKQKLVLFPISYHRRTDYHVLDTAVKYDLVYHNLKDSIHITARDTILNRCLATWGVCPTEVPSQDFRCTRHHYCPCNSGSNEQRYLYMQGFSTTGFPSLPLVSLQSFMNVENTVVCSSQLNYVLALPLTN